MKHVIIGDSDDEHFECICKIIESSFNLNVEPAKSIGEILKKISSPKGAEIKLVLLTEHLPYSANAMRAYFERCHGAERGADRDNHCWIGLVYDGNNPYSRLNLNSDICEVSLPYPSCEEAERLFRERLGAIFGDLKLPDVTLANDMQLKVQVDELAKHWKRNDGEEVLRRLLGGFFSISLMVQRLRSGGSGALVFRVQPLSLGQDAQYLIKFTEDKWKLKEEAKKHPTVVGGTPDYRRYTAEILEPKPESQRDGHVVRCGGWYAICFRFLGGSSFGESVDLEEVLTGPARRMACLSSDDMPTLEAYRTRILSIVLDWLKRHWCANTKYTIRLDQQPWTTVDAEDNAYESLPPYTLRGDVKYRIRQFIDGPKAGESLLSNWPQLADFVKGFVNHTGSGDGSKMNHHVSMILSPAHGDLNANNVLFFPELQDPIFLIDFAMYQEHGHALQDFARLEAEIKYALMDRQQESANKLPGLDQTSTQFPLWCEMEDHLLGKHWEDEKRWSSNDCFCDNVNSCLQLIQDVRRAAREVQQQHVVNAPLDFEGEYRYALLYHTLQAISYWTLSDFKRLLAVYSSDKLLRLAGFGGDAKPAVAE